MPAKKSYRKKQTKKPVTTRKVDIVQDKEIKSIKKDIKMLKGEPELKYCDEYDLVPANITPAGRLSIPLSPKPLQGSGPTDRLGDEIILKKWRVGLKVNSNSAVVGPTNIRIIFFMDKEFNGALPPLLKSGSDYGLLDDVTILDTIQSPYNEGMTHRFKILHDQVIRFEPQTQLTETTVGAVTTLTTAMPVQHRWQKTFYFNKRIKFVSNSNTVAALTGPQPCFACFSDQPLGLYPVIVFSGRIFFQDP